MNIDKNYLFPKDFENYVKEDKPLYICEFVRIFSLLDNNHQENFFTQKDNILEDLQYLKNEDGAYKFTLYPKKNGLLPFGVNDNGDYLFWQVCSNKSDEWKVAILPSRSNQVELLDENFLSFIQKLKNNELVCNSFPKLF